MPHVDPLRVHPSQALPVRRLCRPAVLVAVLLLAGANALAPNPAEARDPIALDEFFKGRIVGLDKKVVTLYYDFSDEEQLKDFRDKVPWRIERRSNQDLRVFDRRMEIIGNSGAWHSAEWDKGVEVEVTVTPYGDGDAGAYLAPTNGANDFLTYTLKEHFFHKWDNSEGGQHSIIKFGDQWTENDAPADYVGFRYLSRKLARDWTSGETIGLKFGLARGKAYMEAASIDLDLSGREKGNKLEDLAVGFYAIGGRATFDNIKMTGKLSKDWLNSLGIELRTVGPIEEIIEGEVDPATTALIAEHNEGKGRATRQLVRIVADLNAAKGDRQAAIQALSTGPREAVRSLIDLLYSTESKVRKAGIGIIESLLGDDYGFDPTGSEGRRSKAIQALNKALSDDPSLLEGSGPAD